VVYNYLNIKPLKMFVYISKPVEVYPHELGYWGIIRWFLNHRGIEQCLIIN
jgi:hypothetical protein